MQRFRVPLPDDHLEGEGEEYQVGVGGFDRGFVGSGGLRWVMGSDRGLEGVEESGRGWEG